ncbi:MAG: hypothetical protein EA397_15200 [Deltaproteobacteria bacterium]|nr:MAG: hypothetical protein EA397_15200 [Deltaproteobacteria bacterium]
MRRLLLPLLLGACATEEPEDPRLCNGYAELCDRPLDQVALPSTHNAMSNSDEGWLAPNHRYPPQRQLDDGVRGMLLDTYLWNDEPYLCHSFCEAGATPLVDVLTELATFFRDHPDDVMAIIFENNIDAQTLDATMREAGLDALRYTHPQGAPWPTLAELADQGTPLLVTVENPGDDDPDWHHDFYEIGFDTPYTFREAEDFTCEVLRGSAENDLFLLNHWLSTPLPTREGAREVNTYEILGGRARECAEFHQRIPNLVAVDHYDLGALFEVVEELNGIGETL